jgi:hypothetical protein
MNRRRGDLQVFSLSMLDVIASALGVFLVLVVVLLPYYRRDTGELIQPGRSG